MRVAFRPALCAFRHAGRPLLHVSMQRLKAVLAALWDSLFDINQPPVRYLGRALCLDIPITLVLAVLVGLTLPDDGPDFTSIPITMMLPVMCILAPLLETVLMVVIFTLLRLVTRRMAYLAILSTLIWMALHSIGAPAHGLGVAWTFLILSICYLRWETHSLGHAFWMTAALHALHNLPFAVLLLVARFQ